MRAVIEQILHELKQKLPPKVRRQIVEMRCFGSYVRGDEQPDSDLDLLIVLREENEGIQELINETVYDTMWNHDFTPLLAVKIISELHYRELRKKNSFFYQNLQQEGVLI